MRVLFNAIRDEAAAWLLTIALASAAALGQSMAKQKSVTGIVTDETGAGIPNAAVALLTDTGDKPIAHARTGPDGKFKLHAEFSTPGRVSITARGFKSVIQPVQGSGVELNLGAIRLKISCLGPGVICDEVVPATVRKPAKE